MSHEKPYKIYAYPGNVNAVKFLVIAHIGGIGDQVDYPQDFKMGTDNKTEHFLQHVNPTGQVPALKTPEGYIFESNAMALYLAQKVGKGLVGNNAFELGQIQQWIDFSTNWLKQPITTWMLPYNGWGPFDEAKEKEAIASLKGAAGKDPLGILDRHLAKHKFFLGDHLSVADVIIWVGLLRFFTQLAAPEFLADLPHLVRWAKEVAAYPGVKKGNYDKEFVFATKKPELPPPKH